MICRKFGPLRDCPTVVKLKPSDMPKAKAAVTNATPIPASFSRGTFIGTRETLKFDATANC